VRGERASGARYSYPVKYQKIIKAAGAAEEAVRKERCGSAATTVISASARRLPRFCSASRSALRLRGQTTSTATPAAAAPAGLCPR